MTTLIETLADFAAATRYDDLPAHVAEESRRLLLLDSIGCAIGGLSHSRGEIALAYARMQGPGVPGHPGARCSARRCARRSTQHRSPTPS